MGFHRGPKVVTNGLVLALDAGNTKSYPGSGTTWTDKSGFGKNGTLVNGPIFNSANGGSIVTDGTNDYVDCGASFNYTSEAFTMSYWFYFNTFTTNRVDGNSTNPVLFSNGGSTTRGYYAQVIGADGSVIFVTSQSGAAQSTQTVGALSIQKWIKIDITRSGSSVVIYINGINKNLTSGTHINPVSSNYNLTLSYYNDNNYIVAANMRSSQFQIYNRALTAQEIQQNYNATKSRYGL